MSVGSALGAEEPATASVAVGRLESCAAWFDNKPPSPDCEPPDELDPEPLEPELPEHPSTAPRRPQVVVVVVVGFGTVVVVVDAGAF